MSVHGCISTLQPEYAVFRFVRSQTMSHAEQNSNMQLGNQPKIYPSFTPALCAQASSKSLCGQCSEGRETKMPRGEHQALFNGT